MEKAHPMNSFDIVARLLQVRTDCLYAPLIADDEAVKG